jgi:hypothetical protein
VGWRSIRLVNALLPSYLEPNGASMQKPIEGRSRSLIVMPKKRVGRAKGKFLSQKHFENVVGLDFPVWLESYLRPFQDPILGILLIQQNLIAL